MSRHVGVVLVALFAVAACAEELPVAQPTAPEQGVAAEADDADICTGFGCGPENIEGAVVVVQPVPPDPATEDRADALTDPEIMQIVAEIWVANGCVVRQEDEDAFNEASIDILADRLGLTEAQRSGRQNRAVLDQVLVGGENLLSDVGRLEWDDQETRLVPCAA